MKKILLATTAAIAFSAGSAGAADLARPVYKAAPPPPPACAQFGGFYVGANVGYGYADHTWNDRDAWSGRNADNVQRGNVHVEKSGVIGGVQGGYNWQSGCTVFGVEADYSWAGINGSTLESDGGLGINNDSLQVENRLRGMGMVKARTGVVVDNLLIYVTGGFAYGDFRRTATQTDLNAPATEIFSSSKTKWGWTTGVGTEWAFTQNWSIKSEVLYTRFEQDSNTFTCTVFCPVPGRSQRFEYNDSVWTTKIGLNYRFNYAPIVAKY